jgi:hypothetical protein
MQLLPEAGLNQPEVTEVIVDLLLARDRRVNRYPLNLITR